jgi:hypothetical protein
MGSAEKSVAAMLRTTHRGRPGEVGGRIAGFAIDDGKTGELWVVAEVGSGDFLPAKKPERTGGAAGELKPKCAPAAAPLIDGRRASRRPVMAIAPGYLRSSA